MVLLKRKIKSISAAFMAVLLVSSSTLQAHALRRNTYKSMNIDIPSVIVIDEVSGDILYGQKENVQRPIASVTKCMTLLLSLEAIEDGKVSLDQVVTLKETPDTWGTSFYLEKGDKYTIDDLIHMAMLVSANDACLVLAETISGSIDKFVDEMNIRANQLGLTNTKFYNPNGLPLDNGNPGNLSSAKDIAYLVKYIMNNYGDYVSNVVSSKKLMLEGMDEPRYNGNKLLFRNDKHKGFTVDGFKTGYTTEAGHCLAATSSHDNKTSNDKSDDYRTISVSLGGKGYEQRFEEHTRMLQGISDNYSNVKLASKDNIIDTITVDDKFEVKLKPQSDLYALVYNGGIENFSKKIDISKDIQLPIKQGTVLGTLTFENKSNKNMKYSVNLISSENITKGNIFSKILNK